MSKFMFLVVVVFFLAGCSDSKHEYSEQLTTNFLTSCVAGGNLTEAQCGCVLNGIQLELSEEEYIEMETRFSITKQPSDEFLTVITNARVKCLSSKQ